MIGRRFLTVPVYLAAWLFWIASAPAWLVATAIIDLVRLNRGVTLRSGVFVAVYLSCEALGILASGLLWARNLIWRFEPKDWDDIHFRMQTWWGNALFRSIVILFQLELKVEGSEELEQGPYFLLTRHASAGDTILASTFASSTFGLRLRYVLKKELLWDPCLDIVGNRVPNAFVDRDSDDSSTQVRSVKQLAKNLGPNDGVLIFPEGSRFTEAKRLRTIERFKSSGNVAMQEYATSLSHVLAPRPGGVMGLLEQAKDVDVVICSHTGFESAASISQIWNGMLLGNTIHIQYRRISRDDIPSNNDAQAQWLWNEWKNVDAYVKAHQSEAKEQS
jgi:1-acyl-sn-glycerol-3-phosphate acyltransferase